jgi:hypothetical protein
MLVSVLLQANCNPYILGIKDTKPKKIDSQNTLVWSVSEDSWSVSELKDTLDLDKFTCKESAYFLVNNNEVSFEEAVHNKDIYNLKKGWNYLKSYKDGIDVLKTFKSISDIEFVYTYEPITKAWAGYSPDKKLRNKMYKTRILRLKYIEPNKGLYIYAKKALSLKVKSIEVNTACKKLIQSSEYHSLLDSGVKDGFSKSEDGSVFVQSRYFSHHKRGVYGDTRVIFIYPNIKTKKTADTKYGIAAPNIKLKYPKEFEGKNFFVYQYGKQKCYKGIFPSDIIPPYPTLTEIKN